MKNNLVYPCLFDCLFCFRFLRLCELIKNHKKALILFYICSFLEKIQKWWGNVGKWWGNVGKWWEMVGNVKK